MTARRLLTGAATLRLSDADRERALRALKAHYAEGRLSIGEFEARVEDIYRSSTRRDLVLGFRDLPLKNVRRRLLARAQRFQRTMLRMHLFTYAAGNAFLVGVWEITGQGVFWPALFLIPSTALLLAHAALSRMITRALGRLRW